jgi:hypothetical protein
MHTTLRSITDCLGTHEEYCRVKPAFFGHLAAYHIVTSRRPDVHHVLEIQFAESQIRCRFEDDIWLQNIPNPQHVL